MLDPGVGTIPVYSEDFIVVSVCCFKLVPRQEGTKRKADDKRDEQMEHQLQQPPPAQQQMQQMQQSLEGNGHIEPREPPHENSGLPKKVRCVCQ